MSFSDSATPFFPPPFSGNERVGGFWPQFPMNNEVPDPHLQFQHPPPPKRPRNCDDNNPPNSMPFPLTNQRMPPSHPSNPPINKVAPNNIFFKTRICSKFMVGTCRNGESCKFAHGEEDVRKPPSNWQALVAGRVEDRFTGNWENDETIIQRMKLCKKFYNGEECPYGERCNFLHEDPSKFRADMGRYRESSASSIGQRESSAITIGNIESSVVSNGYRESSAISIRTTELLHGSGSDQPESNRPMNVGSDASGVKRPFWKTKLCSKFQAGQCPFGDKCHYAHGIADLQVPSGRSPSEVGNVINVLTRPAPFHANDQLPINTGTEELSKKQEEKGKKCLLKFKGGSKKINSIYGDWIDELPLVSTLPNNVEI